MLRDTTLINAAVEQGLIDADELARLQMLARRERRDLLTLVCFSARIPLVSFYRAYAELHGIPFVQQELQADSKLLRKLPRTLTERRLMLPLLHEGEALPVLVVADPEDRSAIEQARRLLGGDIEVKMTLPSYLQRALSHSQVEVLGELGVQAAPPFDPVATLTELFNEAYLLRASDIHFEPLKARMQIRLRVDGRLQEYPISLSLSEGQSLMSRMKVLAGMDIAEQRMPQDGNLSHQIPESNIGFDIRAATLPTRFGERATLRLLGSDSEVLSLEKIGFCQHNLAQFQQIIHRPHGMILVTGPTGSGKSTTLYAALQQIATREVNVMTAEDPVEYVMEGIAQVHVNSKVSFADALRSFLRHDPDVIMVGEIRDGETANIALKAAMTGHLVFSTVHTNSAISTINRLVDMGVERFLIGSTLAAVIAQRLVRKLCLCCRQPYTPSDSQRQQLLDQRQEEDDITLYKAIGCANCMGSGYKGRLALFETLWVDGDLGELIGRGADESALRQQAKHFVTLQQDSKDKLLSGLTSWEELYRLKLVESQLVDEVTA